MWTNEEAPICTEPGFLFASNQNANQFACIAHLLSNWSIRERDISLSQLNGAQILVNDKIQNESEFTSDEATSVETGT